MVLWTLMQSLQFSAHGLFGAVGSPLASAAVEGRGSVLGMEGQVAEMLACGDMFFSV